MPDDENDNEEMTTTEELGRTLNRTFVRQEDFDALVERVAALEAKMS